MANEIDLVAAVRSENPRTTYGEALARDDVFWSDRLDCWVAVRPGDVEAVLASERCLVRPPGEAVPRALFGTSLGEMYSRLARMSDGERHCTVRWAVEQALGTLDLVAIAEVSSRLARELLVEREDLDRFLTALSVATLASVCGIPDEVLPKAAVCARSVVRAIAPGASAEEVSRGSTAVDELSGMFAAILDRVDPPAMVDVLRRLLAGDSPDNSRTAIANLIGFLIQSHDATAGLIGNALVRLARQKDVPRTRDSISRLVVDVARSDPSVHNTRRYAGGPVRVGGAWIDAGDAILVGLAAANLADGERSWSFGAGRHACPGRDIALTIAMEGVVAVCEAGMLPESFPNGPTYRPLGNVRIPRLVSTGNEREAE